MTPLLAFTCGFTWTTYFSDGICTWNFLELQNIISGNNWVALLYSVQDASTNCHPFAGTSWQWLARAPAFPWVTTLRRGSLWPKWPWRTFIVTSSPSMRNEKWGNFPVLWRFNDYEGCHFRLPVPGHKSHVIKSWHRKYAAAINKRIKSNLFRAKHCSPRRAL